MKKNLSTCIHAIDNNGEECTYSTIEEASDRLGLTKRQIELRATKGEKIGGTTLKWCDPATKRSYLGKRSRRKGNSWELDIINHLKKIGYTGCVSSRSESKRMDDIKIDIIDTDHKLPCYIQAKATKNLPNYHKIEQECPLKDLPFVIACKQVGKSPVAILPMNFFYKLLEVVGQKSLT